MQTVRDALEAAGCRPQGPLWKFKALCPAHDDRAPSLSVQEGSDHRVLVHCFAGCEPTSIVERLGLSMGDLFPIGHREGHRRRPKTTRSLAPAEALIVALSKLGLEWSGLIASPCPYCGCLERVWWRIKPDRVDVDCPEGCGREEILRALDNRLALEEAA
jgi:hypothetical protein